MSLYLGIDCSTQSATAIVLDAARDRRGGAGSGVVFQSSLQFDQALPQYGTRHGMLPADERGGQSGLAVSTPLLWADALDAVLGRVAASGLDLSRLTAIAGSAQQHGSVYLNAVAAARLARLDPRRAPGDQLVDCLSRPVSPIWMDASTSEECREITTAVGGAATLAQRTGSRAFERFTGPQIRKFYKCDPGAYAATGRIHLVSSFLASLLIGDDAPVDPGDGSGMNLMDLASASWWPAALDATAPALADKLPAIAPSSTIAGRLSTYWQLRHRLPPARVVVWSGDNPCSLIGTGLVREGAVAVSLGTSDTVFGYMDEPRVDVTATGHVFGAPTGAFMGLTCFANGSLARERIRNQFGLTWAGFSEALRATPPGNHGRMVLPWFAPEITPPVLDPQVRRYGLAPDDGPGHVRAVVEAQMLSMALHSSWMGVDVRTIHATGGASENMEIVHVMADVFGAEVRQFNISDSAAFGAAMRAWHADALADGEPLGWDEIVSTALEPMLLRRLEPEPGAHRMYRDLLGVYAEREAAALR